MKSKLQWFLSLLVVLASINNHLSAQSIKRQHIGSLGSSQSMGNIYTSNTAGQPYFTSTYTNNVVSISSGFQQMLSPDVLANSRNEQIKEVTIFPNPAIDKATIFISKIIDQATINVTDISGKSILSDVLTQSNKYEFSCSNWKEGIYFVSIINANMQLHHTSKIIISK